MDMALETRIYFCNSLWHNFLVLTQCPGFTNNKEGICGGRSKRDLRVVPDGKQNDSLSAPAQAITMRSGGRGKWYRKRRDHSKFPAVESR